MVGCTGQEGQGGKRRSIMKISIYDTESVPEPEYRLKLFPINKNIVVALADEQGNRIESTSLVSFDEDMRVSRCVNIAAIPGLPLGTCSQLKLRGED